MMRKKRLLLVDDSEIDREILKNILQDTFEVMEATNGGEAVAAIIKNKDNLDGILLDVSMPVLDGFGVLQEMKDKNINDITVFLITAEANKDNVERAVHFQISDFIKKPFEREEVLMRVCLKLGVVSNFKLTKEDIKATNKYIENLEVVYNRFLHNFAGNIGHYARISELMKIMLKKYAKDNQVKELNKDRIHIISRAGYFCDIGNMLVPHKMNKLSRQDEMDRELYQRHTVYGGDIICLNNSPHCQYFVQVCSDICVHHHERYDGKGFPHKIPGENNSIYTQMCRVAERFDTIFYRITEHGGMQFKLAMEELEMDQGLVSDEILTLLRTCQGEVVELYYMYDVGDDE